MTYKHKSTNEIVRIELVITEDNQAIVLRHWHINGYRRDRITNDDMFVVAGKYKTYVVEGVDTDEQAKRLAIWFEQKCANRKFFGNRLD